MGWIGFGLKVIDICKGLIIIGLIWIGLTVGGEDFPAAGAVEDAGGQQDPANAYTTIRG